jgi:hypothetical protein
MEIWIGFSAMEDPALQRLTSQIFGYVPAHAVHACAELDLADRINSGADTLEQLATETGCDPDALERLLRFLVGLGLFHQVDGRYQLGDMGRFMLQDSPGSQWANARMTGRLVPAWQQIMHSLKTGETGFHKAYGNSLFEHLQQNQADEGLFDTAMTSVHGAETQAMLDSFDFSGFQCVADIGGGNGSVLEGLLRSYPHMQGILFDSPNAAERAEVTMRSSVISERCRFVGGDFFKDIPISADAFLLRHILHDWSDTDAITILRNCRQALPAHGKVLIAEMILPDGDEPSPVPMFDLMMLVVAGGKERSVAAYSDILEAAELTLGNVTPTASPVSIIEARLAQ